MISAASSFVEHIAERHEDRFETLPRPPPFLRGKRRKQVIVGRRDRVEGIHHGHCESPLVGKKRFSQCSNVGSFGIGEYAYPLCTVSHIRVIAWIDHSRSEQP